MADVDGASTSIQQFSSTTRNATIACGECSRPFTKRRDYNRHCKRHKRPYKCGLCSQSFALKTDLERHGASHEKNTVTFKCMWPACLHKGSVRKDNLLKHMKRSHLYIKGLDENEEDREIRKKELIRLYKKATENHKTLVNHRTRKLNLLETLKDQDEEMVKQVLDNLASVQSAGQLPAEVYSEALLWATKFGNASAVHLLLAKGAAIEVTNQFEETPMYIAIEHGHTNVVQRLVRHGADVNDVQCGWISLALAARHGHRALVEYLLEEGVAVDVVNNSTNTALYYAASYGYKDIVRLLLANGADIEYQGFLGSTALHIAAGRGYIEVVEILLASGAKIESTDRWDRTTLQQAANSGHVEVVKLLLTSGAKIESGDQNSGTALHKAATRGHIEVVKLLLAEGAQIERTDHDGWTPLIYAARYGRDAVVSLLLKHGARIDAKDQENWGPLDHAVEVDRTSTVRLLLEMGASSARLRTLDYIKRLQDRLDGTFHSG